MVRSVINFGYIPSGLAESLGEKIDNRFPMADVSTEKHHAEFFSDYLVDFFVVIEGEKLEVKDIVWLNAQCKIVEFTANEKTTEA